MRRFIRALQAWFRHAPVDRYWELGPGIPGLSQEDAGLGYEVPQGEGLSYSGGAWLRSE